MPDAKLKAFQYSIGSDQIDVQAVVDDMMIYRPATMVDPEEWGPAACRTTLLWDNPITHEDFPTEAWVKQRIQSLSSEDWEVVPPIEFDE
jgi:hypothetical protein